MLSEESSVNNKIQDLDEIKKNANIHVTISVDTSQDANSDEQNVDNVANDVIVTESEKVTPEHKHTPPPEVYFINQSILLPNDFFILKLVPRRKKRSRSFCRRRI